MSGSKKSNKPSTTDITTQGDALLSAFQQFASGVPVEDVSPEEATEDRGGNFISDEAMKLAAQIIETNPDRFADFDASSIRTALAYQEAMRPLGTQVNLLGEQITRNVQKQRRAASGQSYALYQSLKGQTTGLSRISKTDPIRAQQRALQKLITTTKKSRATTVTQGEVEDFKKETRKAKVAAQKASTGSASATPASGQATASSPSATPTASEPVTPAPAAVTTGH